MPSMTYCMFENTASEMSQCVEAMKDSKSVLDLELNEYEEEGYRAMYQLSKEFIANYKRLVGDV